MRQQQRSWFPAMFANTFQILMYLYNILTVIILRIRDVDLLTNAYSWVAQKQDSLCYHKYCTLTVFGGFPLYLRSKYFRFYHVVKGFWLVFLARILQAYWILRYYMNSIECDSASKKYSVILSNNIQCKEAVHTGWKRGRDCQLSKEWLRQYIL